MEEYNYGCTRAWTSWGRPHSLHQGGDFFHLRNSDAFSDRNPVKNYTIYRCSCLKRAPLLRVILPDCWISINTEQKSWRCIGIAFSESWGFDDFFGYLSSPLFWNLIIFLWLDKIKSKKHNFTFFFSPILSIPWNISSFHFFCLAHHPLILVIINKNYLTPSVVCYSV